MTVERIEDGVAVIETADGRIEVAAYMLAPDVKEGDAVKLENGIYTADKAETEKRRNEILKLQDSLWE